MTKQLVWLITGTTYVFALIGFSSRVSDTSDYQLRLGTRLGSSCVETR